MNYKINLKQIVRKEIDLAGKHRVWIEMPNGDLQMFKFQKEPRLEEIDAEPQKFIQNQRTSKLNELETINQEIVRLQTRKAELEATK